MDFIERWFGLSPDGGDGTTEALYIAAALVVIGLLLGRRHAMRFAQRWWGGKAD